MDFRDELSDECPLKGSNEITDPIEVFRIVSSDHPTEKDFETQRQRNPEKRSNQKDVECRFRGISVRINLNSARNLVKSAKLKSDNICRVRLDRGAGFIKQTEEDSGHCTWWPLAGYDILSKCIEVTR